MSAFGTKRTRQSLSGMSAFGGKADIDRICGHPDSLASARRNSAVGTFRWRPSSLIGRTNVLVHSKKVAWVEFGLELPQPFERLRIICGLHSIRAFVTKEI